MSPQALCAAALLALWSAQAMPQGASAPAPDPKAGTAVVPYCIEPMESMPPNVRALIDAQFLCPPGAHLTRDSRPARVVPTGEESSGRPFVLRFGPPEAINAWFVRGYSPEPKR